MQVPTDWGGGEAGEETFILLSLWGLIENIKSPQHLYYVEFLQGNRTVIESGRELKKGIEAETEKSES